MGRIAKNPDIGKIKCLFTGEVAPVRRDKNGKLYYVSKAGMIKPNNPIGQDYMLDNAHIFSANELAVNESSSEKPPIVPVNESSSEKPPIAAQSPQPEKPSFLKFLIG